MLGSIQSHSAGPRRVRDERTALAATPVAKGLSLYTGHFLESEPDHLWVLGARERYRSRFLRCVECLARSETLGGDVDEAAALYRLAIERDPINEVLHRGLIRALASAGRAAEARDRL